MSWFNAVAALLFQFRVLERKRKMLVSSDHIAGADPALGPLPTAIARQFLVVLDQVVPAMDIAMIVEEFAPGSTVHLCHDMDAAEAAFLRETPDVLVLGLSAAVEGTDSLAARAATQGAALVLLENFSLPDLPEGTRVGHAVIPFSEAILRNALAEACT